MFQIIQFLEFFTFLAGVWIGGFVLIKSPRNPLHVALAVTAFGMAGWNLAVFLILNELVPLQFAVQNSFAWAAVTGVGFTWFVYQYPQRIKGYGPLSVITLTLGLFFFGVAFHPDFAFNITVPNGYVDAEFHPILYPLWSLFFMGNFLYTFILLLVRTYRASGLERKRYNQIILGFLLFFIPAQVCNLALPLFFNDFRWNGLGPVFTIFLTAFLANAILRYRLFNIRWVISRGFLFTLLATLVVWAMTTITFLISNTVPHKIALGVGAFIIVLAFKPLQALVESVINKLVNHGWYDPETATQQLFEIVRTEGDLENLAKDISDRFIDYFSVKEYGLVVLSVDMNKFQELHMVGFGRGISRKVRGLVNVAHDHGGDIVELTELKWRATYGTDEKANAVLKEHVRVLEDAGVQTLIPLMIEDDIIGLMFFGERRYDRALRPQDLAFLKLVSAGISPALENAAKFAHIKNLYTKLSEADRAKSEFINVVSHSLRTPLSAVRWNLETLLETAGLKKPMREMLNDSHDRAIFLANTLDGLFDVLAIEGGKLKLDRREISVKSELDPLCRSFAQRAKDKNFKFTYDVADASLLVDKKRFLFVCTALLQNAFVFTNEGSVDFKVEKKRGTVVITVTDTGIGIPGKDLKKIFNKFFRGSNAISQSTDGQGLNLYIVKRTVDAHGGDVRLTSELGKGTQVTVTFPMK